MTPTPTGLVRNVRRQQQQCFSPSTTTTTLHNNKMLTSAAARTLARAASRRALSTSAVIREEAAAAGTVGAVPVQKPVGGFRCVLLAWLVLSDLVLTFVFLAVACSVS